MADGVAKVEHGPVIVLALVGLDYASFIFTGSDDDLGEQLAVQGEDFFQILLEQLKQVAVGDNTVFNHLSETGDELSARQRTQYRDIDQNQFRLVKSADQILASDAGINLGEQSRRHLHIRDTAQISRRSKAGEIADHAATERQHARLSFE